MPPRILHIDLESYSTLDIGDVGLENYIRAPGFAVTVVAWAFDGGLVNSRHWPDANLVNEVRTHIREGGTVSAHNAAFEYAVLVDHFGLDVSWDQCDCTMQRALAWGLPAGLLKAGKAIKAPILKDETKRSLMLRMGRPGRDGSPVWMDPVKGPPRLAELAAYCANDVEAERCLSSMLPPLHVAERQLSALDHRINRKGIRIQVADVNHLRRAAEVVDGDINHELRRVTGGKVRTTSERVRMKAWLAANGLTVPSKGGLDKDAVEALLASPARLTTPVLEALRLYQKGSKSSVAKLVKMAGVASSRDDRARNLLQFYGAGRTGRWAGRLIQPQNMPRVTPGHDAVQVINAVRADYASVGMLWRSPLEQISQSLRACFVARVGHVLASVDFSQIEARVLAWLAGQADVLDAFRRGEDVYTMQAGKVGSGDRQLGKVLVLACGYGMGPAKFRETAAKAPYHVTLDEATAINHLTSWRAMNPYITRYWHDLEGWVSESVRRPGLVVPMTNGMAVRTRGGVTLIRKPNSVKLAYHRMRFSDGGLVFDGVNSLTKQWATERTYGGRLAENIVQSVARDIMASAMLRVEAEFSAVPVMTVHDEIVWEVDKAAFLAPEGMQACAEVVPGWAADLPVASSLHVGERYGK
jgi:DNA polymerase bacteriophage-type